MKKILYLFLAVTIFACSSDDSSDTNDDNNQTFLERFDGVVWQSEATEVDAFLIIDNDNYSTKWVINGDCLVWYFDVYNENIESGFNVIVNDYNQLVLDRFDADNNIISRSTTISSSDENSLIETVIFYVDNTESTGAFYRTILTDPCE
jgi:acetyltransferase-like isoleucine patch superfamily enzyme